jgi:hypothetical protein
VMNAPAAPLTLIRPGRRALPVNVGELWEFRELLYFLVWRDIKVRYAQTVLGAAWAIIQPLFTMIVFSLFFGRDPCTQVIGQEIQVGPDLSDRVAELPKDQAGKLTGRGRSRIVANRLCSGFTELDERLPNLIQLVLLHSLAVPK